MTTESFIKSLERFLTPQLNELKGELKAINTRIDELDKRLSGRIDELDKRMNTRFDSINETINTRFDSVNQRINSLSEKIDVIKDVERLKYEIQELKQKTG